MGPQPECSLRAHKKEPPEVQPKAKKPDFQVQVSRGEIQVSQDHSERVTHSSDPVRGEWGARAAQVS